MASGQKSITYASLSIISTYLGFITIFFLRFFLVITFILSLIAIIQGMSTIYKSSSEKKQTRLSLILANFGIVIAIAMLMFAIWFFYIRTKVLSDMHGF